MLNVELLRRRALAIDETAFGKDHPTVAVRLHNLAVLFQKTNRYAEAEQFIRRALTINEASLGKDHPAVADNLDFLAQLLHDTNRRAEAEPLYRRALTIRETSFGKDHPEVADSLNDLAILFKDQGQYGQAEPLFRRALAILEKNEPEKQHNYSTLLDNLAALLLDTNRLAQAEEFTRHSLTVDEANLGKNYPDVAIRLNNLARILLRTDRADEAEQLYRRALDIGEASLGKDHPLVATFLSNIASLREDQGDWRTAIALRKRTMPLMIGFGGGEPMPGNLQKSMLANQAGSLESYARALYRADARNKEGQEEAFVAAQWALQNEAADALSAMAARFAKGGHELAKLVREQQDLLTSQAIAYSSLDVAAGKADAEAAENARTRIAEIEAQLVKKQVALRQAFPDYAELANPKPLLPTAAQALLGEGDALVLFLALPQYGRVPEETIVFALTKTNIRWTSVGLGSRALAERVAALRCGLDRSFWAKGRDGCKALVGAETDFDPNDEAIPEALPFDLARASALYRDLFGGIEDLIQNKQLLIVPSGALTELPFEALVTGFAESDKYGERIKKAGRLGAAVENITPARGVKIAQIIPSEAADKAGLKPNDIVLSLNGQAFSDRERLIAEIQSHTPGAQVSLRVLRDGSEMTLQATLGEMEKREWIPRFVGKNEGERIAWLGQRHAITILPSVGSLKALRAAKASEAPEPFAGFGNPLLTGRDGADKSAWAKQECGKPAPPKQSRIASIVTSIASLFRDGAANVEDLRRQPPLPETADELCAVGRGLGVPEAGLSKAVHLGKEATVSTVKALSASGELARARVVHFATHGLLAGETAMFAKAKAEPALLLTPPAEASEEDNGLLTASEVAQLNLNADWVVMSACNTAAGSADGAEALSGLARAFFYAGARSLLVSHWPVNSEAAVAITTGTVNAMKANSKIGRAEALRRAEAALIVKGGRFAHPSVWAPFVLVGNGGQ